MDVDLLFSLDMLKTHQACIDLEKNVLRIRGREVKFLAEQVLPEKVRVPELDQYQEPDFQPARIKGAVRQLSVFENLECAMEYSPELPESVKL